MIERLKSWLLPSIADVFFTSVLIYFALPTNIKGGLLNDGDTGYHIRAGEYILNTFTVPREDIFSFIFPAIPWTAHEWLSEVFMALLHQFGGLTAVVIAFSIIIAVCIRIFFQNVRSEGNDILLSVIATIIFLILAMVHFLARPHIFSLIILLIWYRLLDNFQYRQLNRLWILPLLMLVWVNLHGGFVIGLTILCLYVAGNLILRFTDKSTWESNGKENCKVLSRVFGLSIIACLVNPIGYNIFLFPFKLLSNKYIMDSVSEFQSPDFHELQPFKYMLSLIIIILAYSKNKPNFIEIILILLFTSMSLYSVRYIPLFAVVVIPILLRYFKVSFLSVFPGIQSFIRQRSDNITSIDNTAKGYLWPTLTIVLLVSLAINGSFSHAFNPNKKPLAALDFMKSNMIAGNMFNNDEFGDFVIYSSYPQYKVFIDGRLDMYGTNRLKEYNKIKDFEQDWESVIDKYKISWIFFDTNSTFSRYLTINNSWKLIYSDKVASIFVKNAPLYQPLIDKFSGVKLATYDTDIINANP